VKFVARTLGSVWATNPTPLGRVVLMRSWSGLLCTVQCTCLGEEHNVDAAACVKSIEGGWVHVDLDAAFGSERSSRARAQHARNPFRVQARSHGSAHQQSSARPGSCRQGQRTSPNNHGPQLSFFFLSNTAHCIWSVIQPQSPTSIAMVSFRRNVTNETSRTRLLIETSERKNDIPNATGCNFFFSFLGGEDPTQILDEREHLGSLCLSELLLTHLFFVLFLEQPR